MLDDADNRALFHFLLPYAEREIKTNKVFPFLPFPMVGIEPGLPLQKASAQSIAS